MTETVSKQMVANFQSQFFDDDSMEIVIILSWVDASSLQISCGEGNLQVQVRGNPPLIYVSDSADKFMNRIAVQMRTWATDHNVGDMGKWLQQFRQLAEAEYEQHMDDDSENEDAKTDHDYYDEENDCAPQDRGGPSAQFLIEHDTKRRWKMKEEQLKLAKEQSSLKSTSTNSSAINTSNNTVDIMERCKKDKMTNLFSSGASSIALTNDLWQLITEGGESGYSVSAVDDNIYCWSVKINQFSEDSPLINDLLRLDDRFGYSYIELQLSFAMDLHPLYPPLVTIIRPRFEGFMLGKIATLPYLQLSQWNPCESPKAIIDKIRRDIEVSGRIDTSSPYNSNPAGSYSYLEHLLLKLGIVTEIAPRVAMQTLVYERGSGGSSSSSQAAQDPGASFKRQKRKSECENIDSAAAAGGSSSSSSLFRLGHTGASPDMMEVDQLSSLQVPAANTSTTSTTSNPSFLQVTAHGKKSSVPAMAKGTGYGFGAQTQWDVKQYLAAQLEKDRLERDILAEVVSEMKKELLTCLLDDKAGRQSGGAQETDSAPGMNGSDDVLDSGTGTGNASRVYRIVEESCLVPLIASSLEKDSFLEMERHADLYYSVFAALRVLCDTSELRSLLGPLDGQNDSRSLLSLCKNLQKQLTIYSKPLITASGAVDTMTTDLMSAIRSTVEGVLQLEKEVLGMARNSGAVHSIVSSGSKGGLKSLSTTLDRNELEELYIATLGGDLRYGEIEDLAQWNAGYHYAKDLLRPQISSHVAKRTKRLRAEHADLSRSLPISLSSSIWMRTHPIRMDAVQVIIGGPEETPYMNGLFLFDVFFPDEYPTHPPFVNLRTTGRGSVRFNPNLYNCGKVCLSLLGTWAGGGEAEKWNDVSSFLQVLVSIQSLILVPDPFYNEPGYEQEYGTAAGVVKSKAYNEERRAATVRWAIIDQLKRLKNLADSSQDTGFDSVIRKHFYIKRDEIKQQILTYKAESSEKHVASFNHLEVELLPILNALKL